ncbi:MAG: hypothetical protein FWC55_05425, partial [Firmicutes bacterium]|nr:hypothetical protein [Bacillota bacterium]
EFGTGTRKENVYMSGDAFLRQFERTCGYDFLSRLFLLNNEAEGWCAAKTRYDYYKVSTDTTYNVQKYVKEAFTRRYGDDVFLGYHHTWWGEGNSGDLWAGNMDYFRLAENLSGGFADSEFYSEQTMLSLSLLAESLAKYAGGRAAYDMSWNFETTRAQVEYFPRMLAARNLRWIAHIYGSSVVFGPGYPRHRTWEQVPLALKYLDDMRGFLGAAESRPKVAMLYCWESAAARNDRFMHYHRLSLKAAIYRLLTNHIELDVIPSTEVNYPYDVLIALWPEMLPEETWEAVKAFAASGKQVIFIGPPARYTTPGGDISGEFAELVGAEPGGFTEYDGEYDYVARDVWFTDERIPMLCAPLTPTGGRVTIRHGENVLGVAKGGVSYYSFEIPLCPYFGSVISGLSRYASITPAVPGALSKLSRDAEGGAYLTMAARWGEALECAFECQGSRIELKNGKLLGVQWKDGEVRRVAATEGTEVSIDGTAREYSVIG